MPAPRPRFVVRGKFAQPYTPSDYREWKERAADYVRGVNERPSEDLVSRPCAVLLIVRAERPKTSKLSHPRPDVDNYAKGVLDAMTDSTSWWTDDRQVVDLRVIKRWAEPHEPPGVEITVTYT